MTSQLPRLDDQALSDRVLEALASAIHDGHFEEGRLPAEPEIAEQMGVSRTTVRNALRSLEQIGVIERRPGRGTRLRTHVGADVLSLHGLVPFSRSLALNHEVVSQSRLAEELPPPDDYAERLGLDESGEVVTIERSLAADGVPAMLLREVIPLQTLTPGALAGSLFDSILELNRAGAFVREIDHAVAKVLPTLADAEIADALGVDPNTPLTLLREVFFDAEGGPVAMSDVWICPECFVVTIVRSAGS